MHCSHDKFQFVSDCFCSISQNESGWGSDLPFNFEKYVTDKDVKAIAAFVKH